MKTCLLLIAVAASLLAEPRIDNVLVKMVPPHPTALVGARMDQIKQTAFYRKLLSAQQLPQFDRFTQATGFDPRRDVRELLYVNSPAGEVLLARGAFQLNPASLKSVKSVRHGEYLIWTGQAADAASGFCILDSTLAIAGSLEAVKASLTEWKSGPHNQAQALLARVAPVNPETHLWAISTAGSGLLARELPHAAGGVDLTRILSTLGDTWFEANLSRGLDAQARASTTSEKDALSLRDAIRGVVGLGRLSVPDNQPELVRLWDGIGAEQSGRIVTIRATIPEELLDKLILLLASPTSASPAGRLRQLL